MDERKEAEVEGQEGESKRDRRNGVEEVKDRIVHLLLLTMDCVRTRRGRWPNVGSRCVIVSSAVQLLHIIELDVIKGVCTFCQAGVSSRPNACKDHHR